jgi:hypothetical protein
MPSVPEPQELHKRAADSAKETRSTLITLTTAAVGGLVFTATREFKPALITLEKDLVLLTIVLMVGSLGAAIWFAYSDAQWSYNWGAELDGSRDSEEVKAAIKGKNRWHAHKIWSERCMLILFVLGALSGAAFVVSRIFH